MSSASKIATALGGQRSGDGWACKCPAHDDKHPSLSVSDGAGGKVLVRCHAGCSQEAVISALRARGLWNNRAGRSSTPQDNYATVQPGCTLDQYASAKNLPTDFLKDLGITQTTYKSAPR